jgi:glycosyltransferase involved in cell wall biosynthesis
LVLNIYTAKAMKNIISIIIPTFNEIKHGYVTKAIDELCNIKDIEIIIVDGGSSDDTYNFCKSKVKRCFIIENSNRAQRMNYGFKMSTADVILFHHPRSFLSKHAINELKKFNASTRKEFWGGFTHQFDSKSMGLRFTSWYSNCIRSKIIKIIYLDHCIFASRTLVTKSGGFPEREIFEDTDFSKKLKKFLKPILLKSLSKTSSVRFQKNGFFIQGIMNQIMKVCYFCHLSDSKMNAIYEKGLSLNNCHGQAKDFHMASPEE